MGITTRLTHAWNAFKDGDTDTLGGRSQSASYRPGGRRYSILSKATIANTVFNRIALDASMVSLRHVKVDKEGSNLSDYESSLIDALTLEANKDQSGIAFVHDLVYSLLDEGVVAVVPVDTTVKPSVTGGYEINTLRVGKIVDWGTDQVSIRLYNDRSGQEDQVTMDKSAVAIIENPLYSITNGSDGLLDRILRKMEMLDSANEDDFNQALNLILQMPYSVKGDKQRQEAENRVATLEAQLSHSKHGIGYVDSTEKITQLNRSVPDGLQEQIKYLTEQFYNAIGLTQNVFDGTAGEAEMRAYYNRTIDPIVSFILAEINRKFLSKTARSQGQKIVAFRDPFKLVPVEQLATIADTFSRNEILSSNELRGIVGYAASSDPRANELKNKNVADVNQETANASTSVAATAPVE